MQNLTFSLHFPDIDILIIERKYKADKTNRNFSHDRLVQLKNIVSAKTILINSDLEIDEKPAPWKFVILRLQSLLCCCIPGSNYKKKYSHDRILENVKSDLNTRIQACFQTIYANTKETLAYDKFLDTPEDVDQETHDFVTKQTKYDTKNPNYLLVNRAICRAQIKLKTTENEKIFNYVQVLIQDVAEFSAAFDQRYEQYGKKSTTSFTNQQMLEMLQTYTTMFENKVATVTKIENQKQIFKIMQDNIDRVVHRAENLKI